MLGYTANANANDPANGNIHTIRLREDPPPITPAQRPSRKRKSPPDPAPAQDQPQPQPQPQPPPPPPPIHHVLPPMMPHHPMQPGPPIPGYYDFTPGGMQHPPPPGADPSPQNASPPPNSAAGRALSSSKRAEQNRKAQRAFRERRDQHVKALESRSQLLDAALASADEANRRWEECRALVDQLRVENAALRAALSQAQMLPPGAVGPPQLQQQQAQQQAQQQPQQQAQAQHHAQQQAQAQAQQQAQSHPTQLEEATRSLEAVVSTLKVDASAPEPVQESNE
ncbi:hypothetical protein H0H81_011626 [Sphagnurus paluster]|uniref:BZIP domain-containing protein n=1 Tax=Sphagnurus paluster TaxID=117069 RepID=A0A9P7GPE3_9AGAR|nr:hypothetical protein H0H81_011626 [Sphagnurus paluster]